MKVKLEKILYSFFAFLPFFISAVFYTRLPEQVAVHFDAANNPNGYLPKAAAAFGVPALFLIIVFLVNFSFYADPKSQNISRSPQIKLLVQWGLVILDNVVQCAIIFNAIKIKIDFNSFCTILVGLLIAAIGNYLPKCKYNYSLGIKLPWTLADEENWRKTHCFSGLAWIIGGVFIALNAFIPCAWLKYAAFAFLTILPAVYSYLYISEKSRLEIMNR